MTDEAKEKSGDKKPVKITPNKNNTDHFFRTYLIQDVAEADGRGNVGEFIVMTRDFKLNKKILKIKSNSDPKLFTVEYVTYSMSLTV